MSSVSDLEQLFIGAYINVAADALYLFESFITLSQEVEVIWGARKWSTMTWLYACTRYAPFLLSIFQLVVPWSRESCVGVSVVAGMLSLAEFICFALFSFLRVYALLGGRLFIAGIVLTLNLVPLFTNLFTYSTSQLTWDEDGSICNDLVTQSPSLSLSLSLSTRIAVIIADVVVLTVTWYKTGQTYMEARRLKIRTPLIALLLRDGTTYFVVLTVINILLPVANDIPSLVNLDLVASFVTTLVPIVVCRFILNLRQLDRSESSQASDSLQGSVSLRFAGNAGEPLRTVIDKDNEDNDLDEQYHYGMATSTTEAHV